MKFYHFGLAFAVIATGFFVILQARQVCMTQGEEIQRNEYESLVAAVNAATEEAFSETNTVGEEKLSQISEVFFQTLAVLHGSAPNMAECDIWRVYVPCLVLLEERGYYRYCFTEGAGYGWSELIPYEGEEIPKSFFTELEEILECYHELHYTKRKTYRMEAAEAGIWENSLSKSCIFAIYASPFMEQAAGEQNTFLYAAAGRAREVYLVTEDNYCHLPSCKECNEKKVVARYSSQKKSAMEGAMPCELCLKQ